MKKIVNYSFLKEQVELDEHYIFSTTNDINAHYVAKTKFEVIYKPTNMTYITYWDKWRIGHRPHNTNKKLSSDVVKNRINSDQDFSIVEPFEYINAFTKFKVKNKNTDEIFEVTLNNWNKGKRPAITDSQVEDFIKKILTENNICFSMQQTFNGLLSKKNKPLKIDFYIPNINVAIEYNGPYHYKPIRGESHLKIQQENDNIKLNFCKKNNITLHVINSSKWKGYACNFNELKQEILNIIQLS